jgi:hypothetical protein
MKVFVGYNAKEKHGMTGTDTYIYWKGLKQKCNARGSKFKMAYRWNDFRFFLEDVGVRPYRARLLMLEEEKGFVPGNCIWSEGKDKLVVDYKTVEGRVNSTYGLSTWEPPRGVQYVK